MKFLVLGSLNIDMVFSVDHIVRAGETISSTNVRRSAGGKGANQAAALGKAGADVYFAGKIGSDGEWVLRLLESFGVKTEKTIVSAQERTGQALIQLDAGGQNSIILDPAGNRRFEAQDLERIFAGFSEGDVLVVQNEINLSAEGIERAKKAGMRVCLNPSPFEEAIRSWPLDLVDFFCLNEIEAAQMAGEEGGSPLELLRKLVLLHPHAGIVLTAGRQGAWYADAQTEAYAPIVDMPVVDTTGAGDTFSGYFFAALFGGRGVQDSLALASLASGMTVSRSGAMESMPLAREVFG